MAGDVYRVAMEGEDGMNMSISFKSDKRTIDRDIVNMCRLRYDSASDCDVPGGLRGVHGGDCVDGGSKMKSAYICHPLRGKTGSPEEIKSNLERIDEIAKNLAAIYPDVLLLSPLHAFSFYDPRGPQEQVLGQCVAMLERADEIWLFGDWRNSVGCTMEREYALQLGKKIIDMTDAEEAESNEEILRRLA